MNFKDLVNKRYSCRKYKDKPVEREKIDRCLKAARLAPSACNAQPWEFVVLDDEEKRAEVAGAAASGAYSFSKFIKEAPVLILVLADRGSFMSKAGSLVRNTKFYLMDIGIVSEHIVLQATEEDLGTCYVGWINAKKIKKVLKIPKKLEIPFLITMGYPREDYKDKDPIRKRAGSENRKSMDDIVSFNKYA
ncbi:MAG: nitroreductase family protein [Elusimicrobiota bacterium]